MNHLQVQNPQSREFAQNVNNVFKMEGSDQIGSESFHPNKLGGKSSSVENLDKFVNMKDSVNVDTSTTEKLLKEGSPSIAISNIASIASIDNFKQSPPTESSSFVRNLTDIVSINYALFTFFLVFVILYVIPPMAFLARPKSNQRVLWKVIVTSLISSAIVYFLSIIKIF